MSVPLPAEGAGRIYRQIAERIRLGIADGRFPAGTRLPGERDLARQFAVSRTTVREALIALEIGGFVDVRLGSGITVASPLPYLRPLFDQADAGPGPFELLRARWIVEGEVAGWAARSIDEAALGRLERSLAALRAPGASPSEQDDADRDFHLGIAEATGNGALIQTVRMLWDQRRGPMWQKLVEHFSTPSLRALVVADHDEILRALAARAPLRARRAMRRHLARVTQAFARTTDDDARPAVDAAGTSPRSEARGARLGIDTPARRAVGAVPI